jgi:DNA invertase Pin-like site-specific DNA recombinase
MPISTTEIPAAQYLRMSTGLQEYSLENQSRAIAEYARQYGFFIVQTYSDPARSGVLFRRRKGLQKLIHDVVQGQAIYKAILVYDVSRWGAFLTPMNLLTTKFCVNLQVYVSTTAQKQSDPSSEGH